MFILAVLSCSLLSLSRSKTPCILRVEGSMAIYASFTFLFGCVVWARGMDRNTTLYACFCFFSRILSGLLCGVLDEPVRLSAGGVKRSAFWKMFTAVSTIPI